jgi:hypothetical protein
MPGGVAGVPLKIEVPYADYPLYVTAATPGMEQDRLIMEPAVNDK